VGALFYYPYVLNYENTLRYAYAVPHFFSRRNLKLTFLGTRGYIDVRTRRHYRHASLLVTHKKTRIMIDCGIDWERKVHDINADAIFITHAHPDHAWGLKKGAPCPVYATRESWEILKNYPVEHRLVKPKHKISLGGITLQAFPVVHSIRAPAVGYRITAARKSFFYVPDLIDIVDRHKALHGAKLYIGDGATITRPMVRRKGDKLFGHTTIRAQLGWCQQEEVPRAIFSHCGTQIVGGDGRKLGALIRRLGKERGVDVSVAHDGMEIML